MKIKGKWNKKTANKKADLSKIKTKTMMDLYMVMKNNPKTKKEKDAVKKLFDELKKRGELPQVKWPDPLREDTTKITKEKLKELVEVKLADSLSGKDIIAKMKKDAKFKWQDFIGKKGMEAISKKGKWTYKELDQLLPDYVPGQEISGLFKGE